MSRKVETDDLLVFEGIVSKNSRTRVGQQLVALQTVHGLNNNDVTEAGLEGRKRYFVRLLERSQNATIEGKRYKCVKVSLNESGIQHSLDYAKACYVQVTFFCFSGKKILSPIEILT